MDGRLTEFRNIEIAVLVCFYLSVTGTGRLTSSAVHVMFGYLTLVVTMTHLTTSTKYTCGLSIGINVYRAFDT